MKNLKKLLSGALAFAMALTSMTFVQAEVITPTKTDAYEDYAYGWTYDYVYATEEIPEDVFMCVTDEKAKSGTHSMLINNPIEKGAEVGRKPTRIVQSGIVIPEGTYTFSVWFAGTTSGSLTMVKLSDNTTAIKQINRSNMTQGETVNGWTNYTYEFVVSADTTKGILQIMQEGRGVGAAYEGTFIDDVSLINNETGKDVITNGSFDDDGKLHWTDEHIAYEYGWAEDYAGAEKTDDVFMCVTDEKAKEGSRSMLIYNSLAYNDTKATGITQKGLVTPAGTYTFSVWFAGTTTNYGTMISLSSAVATGDYLKQYNKKGLTVGETVGEWTNYTCTFVVEADATNATLQIMQQGGSNGTFIDNVSLTDAKGNEFIENGGFEDDGTIEYTTAHEEYLNGWSIGYGDATQSDDVFICVTDNKVKNGNYSALIRNNVAYTDGAAAICLSQTGFLAPAGDYIFSFWASGEYSGWKTIFSLNGEKYVGCNMDNCTAVETAGRWTKYEYTFTVPEGYTNNTINIIRQGDSKAMYIDDVSLIDANGNELLVNGGFEIKGDLDAFVNPVAYPTSEGNAITLTWKNPAKAYDEIKVYFDGDVIADSSDETNPIAVLTEANGFNEIYYSGIENYTEHVAKIEALRNDEVVSSVELPVWTDDLGVTVNYAGNQPLGAWNYAKNENIDDGYYANTVAAIDYEEKAEGNSSIKLTGNMEATRHLRYPSMQQTVTLDQGTKYVLQFKAKLNNVGSLFVIFNTNDLGETIRGTDKLVSSFTTQDWKTYTVPLVFENENGDTTFDSLNSGIMYNGTIQIAVEKMVGSINIDDVKIYSVEEDDDTYTPIDPSENLIVNGGFEFGTYTVEDAKFELVDGAKPVKIDAIQSGNIKVTTGIRNISMGDEFKAATVIAVYNNGKLVSCSNMLEREYDESSVYLPSDKYSATVTIPEMTENDKYEIKVMYWDGISTMTPLDTADYLN